MKLLDKNLLFLIASVLALSGCPFDCGGNNTNNDIGSNPCEKGDDGKTAADAADAAAISDQVASLSKLVTDSVDLNMPGLTSNLAAQFAANGTAANLMVAGCLTRMYTENRVTFTANNCLGPKYGLKTLGGTWTATYNVMGQGAPYSLTVELSGDGLSVSALSVNSATLNVRSSAAITVAGANRTATVALNKTTATPKNGDMLTLTGDYTAGWDVGMCVTLRTLSGDFSTQSNMLSWRTALADYKRCPDECPQTGTITLESDCKKLSLSFTRNNKPNQIIDGNPSGLFSLICP